MLKTLLLIYSGESESYESLDPKVKYRKSIDHKGPGWEEKIKDITLCEDKSLISTRRTMNVKDKNNKIKQ